MGWDFSWMVWLIYLFVGIFIAIFILNMVAKIFNLFPHRKNEDRIENKTINREVFKELSATAKMNRLPRIKYIVIKPSKHQLGKVLGKYKGHVPDKRFLILRVKTSKAPWRRAMLLFVPYVLIEKNAAKSIRNGLVMPLTLKNIELYIEGVMKYTWWWLAIPRKDSSITQEEVEALMAEWMSTHQNNRYLIVDLPPEARKAPTSAASSPQQIEQRIVLSNPPAQNEEEKEVPE